MDQEMHEPEDSRFIPMTSVDSGYGREAAPDVYYYTDQIANVLFVGDPEQGEWVMIDAGLPGSADEIRAAAADRFGEDSRPSAIILTHGHFDHIGGLVDLVNTWQVPVYAHELEMPYLTGQKRYPKPDMSVEGGVLAKISGIYPNEPVDLADAVQPLPEDHTVPEMAGWEWFHTPGHSPGHVSLYRDDDSLLISGDAFITVRQDSFYNVLMQNTEVNGPPRYLTTDWEAARQSVEKLETLQPDCVVPGHGRAMEGADLAEGLHELVRTFDQTAVPDYGRFVDDAEQ
ncbi:MBL fold metallo-hydrolase [Barrientosiimonas marina]|uniref:MBL fold metallo-hydrolase n=1 Tax=Lentibacillus kimchii TaxID=1542911 RepID=A0ABW2USW7_9BACI